MIDLHGLSTTVALEQFITYYNNEVKNKNLEPIQVVHGYGSKGVGGEISRRLRAFLKDHPDQLHFETGEDLENNPGYTLVYPSWLLPSMPETISARLLEFCRTAKTVEKIHNKFRVLGDAEVKAAIRSLEQQGQLKAIVKGKVRAYISVGMK
jgi:hypothetical protein